MDDKCRTARDHFMDGARCMARIRQADGDIFWARKRWLDGGACTARGSYMERILIAARG